MSLRSVSSECSCDSERQSSCDTISATSLLAKIPQTLSPSLTTTARSTALFYGSEDGFGNDNGHIDIDINRRQVGLAPRRVFVAKGVGLRLSDVKLFLLLAF